MASREEALREALEAERRKAEQAYKETSEYWLRGVYSGRERAFADALAILGSNPSPASGEAEKPDDPWFVLYGDLPIDHAEEIVGGGEEGRQSSKDWPRASLKLVLPLERNGASPLRPGLGDKTAERIGYMSGGCQSADGQEVEIWLALDPAHFSPPLSGTTKEPVTPEPSDHVWILVSDEDEDQTEFCKECGAQRNRHGALPERATVTGGWPSAIDCDLLAVLRDPDAAFAKLPPEVQQEYIDAQESVLVARGFKPSPHERERVMGEVTVKLERKVTEQFLGDGVQAIVAESEVRDALRTALGQGSPHARDCKRTTIGVCSCHTPATTEDNPKDLSETEAEVRRQEAAQEYVDDMRRPREVKVDPKGCGGTGEIATEDPVLARKFPCRLCPGCSHSECPNTTVAAVEQAEDDACTCSENLPHDGPFGDYTTAGCPIHPDPVRQAEADVAGRIARAYGQPGDQPKGRRG